MLIIDNLQALPRQTARAGHLHAMSGTHSKFDCFNKVGVGVSACATRKFLVAAHALPTLRGARGPVTSVLGALEAKCLVY